mgnify:CR=1 FL=1
MNTDWQLVVTPYQEKGNDTGLVKVLFALDQEDQVQNIDESQTGKPIVWISSGYSEIIKQYQPGDLLFLEKFSESEKFSDNYLNTRTEDRADYWSTSKVISLVEESKIVPVINADLPDKASGILKYLGELPRSQFFIRNGDFVYGPFHHVVEADGQIKAEPHTQLAMSLQQNYVAKIPESLLKEQSLIVSPSKDELGMFPAYLTSLKDIKVKIPEKIVQEDFINDAQLVSYFSKSGFGKGKSPLTKKNAKTLEIALAEQSKKTSQFANDPRVERLNDVLGKYITTGDHSQTIIDEWLSSSTGQDFLSTHFKANPTLVSTQSSAVEETGQEINGLKAIKQQLESDISKERNHLVKEKLKSKQELEAVQKELKEQVAQSKQEFLESLGAEVQELEEKKKIAIVELNSIVDKVKEARSIETLEVDHQFLKRTVDGIKEDIKTQRATLMSPNLDKDMTELFFKLELLQGRSLRPGAGESQYLPSAVYSEDKPSAEAIVNYICNQFEEGGRTYGHDEMANLLITMQQSFMTILKGRPGSGKTSSVIRLAQAHGISCENEKGDDFLNVPVSRGWVSGRDFIGFYNSLNNTYQPSRTGIYQFLKNGQEELESDRNMLRMILLDEANLSPIEHYMSDFIGMFDPEGRSRAIDTGSVKEGERYLSVPKNVRIVATINSDGTTELLSPRMCDRVPVISMDFQNSDSSDVYNNIAFDGAVPYEILEEYFGIKPDQEDSSISIKIRNIIDLMEVHDRNLGRSILVSSRKKNAIRNYYQVATSFMDETHAADFAVSQYLLPLIEGCGKGFSSRLESIKGACDNNGYERSKYLLEDIISIGRENIDNYSFF